MDIHGYPTYQLLQNSFKPQALKLRPCLKTSVCSSSFGCLTMRLPSIFRGLSEDEVRQWRQWILMMFPQKNVAMERVFHGIPMYSSFSDTPILNLGMELDSDMIDTLSLAMHIRETIGDLQKNGNSAYRVKMILSYPINIHVAQTCW